MDADVFEMQVNSVLKNIFQKEKKKRERERFVALTNNEVRLEKLVNQPRFHYLVLI